MNMKYWGHCLLFMLGLASVCSCTDSEKIVHYRGIAVDDANGSEGLYNPERGFRLETAVDLVTQKECPTLQLDTLSLKYASDSVSLSQSYFYLTYLTDKKLSDTEFQTMQVYFDRLRQLGKKTVLRFAYEKDFVRQEPVGPTLKEALAHLDQLKPFLHKNRDLILVVQAGVIGAWGEWHSSIHGLEHSDTAKIAILEKLLEVVPAEKNVQVRLPEFKNLLKGKPELYKRVSFHDDFIVIKPDRWDGDMHEGTPNFEQIVKESPYLVVDGELPWGFWSAGCDPDSPSAGWIIDGMGAARRFFLQHYTSLSVIHNYKEQHPNRMFDEANAPEYSMIVWKKSMINADSLRKYHMPVSDHYFQKKDGTLVSRSIFDYIRDHLGYRIELQRLGMPQTIRNGEVLTLNLEFINRGFAGFSSEPSAGWIIDGMGAARRFFLQHYTSLSVIHNYKEQHPNRMFDEANAPEYSMIVWKKSMINADSLRKYHMPVSDHYFQKKDGTLVSRSIFDYIRDHLGYRIELQRLGMPQTIRNGEVLTLNLEFINRGFAGFSSERPAYFVLIDEKEGIMELPALFSSSDCQPYQPEDVTYTPLVHSISFAGKVPVSPGNYRLGLWLPDVSERLKYNSRYAVRCANGDVDWWVSKDGRYGVNVLATIQIKP